MPLFEYRCLECGNSFEMLVIGSEKDPECPSCGGGRVEKLISASSSLTGRTGQSMPGPGDSTCCGHAPGVGGCAGPGSCCGKA